MKNKKDFYKRRKVSEMFKEIFSPKPKTLTEEQIAEKGVKILDSENKCVSVIKNGKLTKPVKLNKK